MIISRQVCIVSPTCIFFKVSVKGNSTLWNKFTFFYSWPCLKDIPDEVKVCLCVYF
jgi:hypothetical protein